MIISDITLGVFPFQPWNPTWYLIYILLKILLKKTPTKETRSIVILGTKGAGKTSLWNALRNIKEATSATYQEKVSQFDLKFRDKTISVEETYDVGGGDSLLSVYESLIKDNTYIYYLFNVNRQENKEDVKSIDKQIETISEISRHRMGVGLKFIGTHCDECEKDKSILYKEILRNLGIQKKHLHILNLQDPKDVEIIINEIVNNITDYA